MAPKKAHEVGQLRTVIVAWVGDVVAAMVGPLGPLGPLGPTGALGPSSPNGLLGQLVRRRSDERIAPEGEATAYPLRPAVRTLRVRTVCARRPGSAQSPNGRRRWDGAPSRCPRTCVDRRGVPLQPPDRRAP